MLLVRYDGVGDTVVLAPLIAALHREGHEIGLVASPAAAALFRPDLMRVHIVPDATTPYAVLPDVRERRYDTALIATEKPYGYRLAVMAGIRERIGFWNGLAKPLKSIWVRSLCTGVRYRGTSDGGRHEVESLFLLGRHLHSETHPTCDSQRLRSLFFATAPERSRDVSVQITPKWGAFGEVAALAAMVRELAEHVRLRLIGAAAEAVYLDDVERAARLPIERHAIAHGWIARIAASRMLVTPDTGAAHVAGMVGTKAIDCFPPDTRVSFRKRWRPWAAPAVLLTMQSLRERGTLVALQEACAELDEPFTPEESS